MTLAEFRAWLDGFRMAIDTAPTEEQWSLIQDKLATVCEAPINPPVYIPYYERPLPQWPQWYTTCHSQGLHDAAVFFVDGT